MIKETGKISVLSYNENRASVIVAPDKSYSFDPSADGVIPCVIPMTLDETRYANNTGAFKNGMLFFDPNREEDVYGSLNIVNWKDVLKNKDIGNIIISPTYGGLAELISIKDSAMFERIRTVYQKIKNEGTNDIPARIEQIIKTRYKELLNRQVNTSIVLIKKDVLEKVSSDEIDTLKEQNRSMREQPEKMQKMMEQMMIDRKTELPITEEAKKMPERPKKTQQKADNQMTEITPFECLFERFCRRIEKDEEFFNYYNVDISEAIQLAHDRMKGCLVDALDILSSISSLQVDFPDYDAGSKELNFKTTPAEIKLIVDLMFQAYMERDLPLFHAFKINLTPGDLSVFSPANERNLYEAFTSRLDNNNEIALDDYKSRDRCTSKFKRTINYSAFSDI